jgi:hypothetical protein
MSMPTEPHHDNSCKDLSSHRETVSRAEAQLSGENVDRFPARARWEGRRRCRCSAAQQDNDAGLEDRTPFTC